MRVRVPFALVSFPLIGTIFVVSVVSAAAPGCADALHLDPPTTTSAAATTSTTSTSTSTSSGAGGSVGHPDGGTDGGKSCKSNPDCAYPAPVCDTVTQTCVQCLVVSDCEAMPGTVCSEGSCACPAPPTAPLTYCTGETPACIDPTTSATNCGGCGNICYGDCAASKCPNGWLAIPVTLPGTPGARSNHVAVWTGSQMFIWGGQFGGAARGDGALFDPVARVWTSVSTTNAPTPRWGATAVWDDVHKQIIVWGGTDQTAALPQGGGIYDPATDMWTATSTGNNLPAGRFGHTALWLHSLPGFPGSTSGMVIFGGEGATVPDTTPFLSDGEVFDPSLNEWLGGLQPNAMISPRGFQAGTWDGTHLLIFGGESQVTTGVPPNQMTSNVSDGDGFLLDISAMTWTTPTAPLPSARWSATGLYDTVSTQTLVWGGYDGLSYHQDGAQYLYSATGGAWTTLGSGGPSPEGRSDHSSAIVTVSGKSQLIVFGGYGGNQVPYGVLGTGWVLDIAKSTWSEIPTPGPSARQDHTAVSYGSTMIIWGGTDAGGNPLQDGAIYTATP